MENSSSPYLTNEEAAAWLKLAPSTLEKHRTIGGGPKFRKFGRSVRYTIQDLEAWSQARACESTSDPTYTTLRTTGP